MRIDSRISLTVMDDGELKVEHSIQAALSDASGYTTKTVSLSAGDDMMLDDLGEDASLLLLEASQPVALYLTATDEGHETTCCLFVGTVVTSAYVHASVDSEILLVLGT